MPSPDLNLLITLNVLLDEGNVARAAKRLRLSPSAMSRSLTRLRETLGDPLLVRAGRGLVPTPRALELRKDIGRLTQEVLTVLSPASDINLKQIARTFTLRSSDGFVENFGPELVERVARRPPVFACGSSKRRRKIARPCVRASLIWKPGWSVNKPARRYAHECCFETSLSA